MLSQKSRWIPIWYSPQWISGIQPLDWLDIWQTQYLSSVFLRKIHTIKQNLNKVKNAKQSKIDALFSNVAEPHHFHAAAA
jgi:hypothetical protein